MKKFLLTLVLLVGLVGITQAAVVFEDDFEAYTEGATPDWYNPKGDVTVTVDDGSVFVSENQYVNMTNPGGARTVLRDGFYSVTDTLATLSFDINEPGSSTGRFVVKCSSGGTTWLRNPSVNVLFNNGVVSAGGQSAAYTVDAPHHVDIVVNLTAASGTYYGNTLEYKCYDVWIDYKLVLSNVPFSASAAYRIYGIQFEIPDADVGTINLDNVELHDEAYLSKDFLAASDPVPANMKTGVPLDAALSWDAGIDIATGSYANVSEYKLYIGYPVTDTSRLTDPNLMNDPNLIVTSTIVSETGLNGGSWTPPAGFLERDITYAWRVDEILADANDTVVPGANWAFTTLLSVPVINSESPADTAVGVGEYAELAVDATNPFTQDATGLSYQWMYSPDGVTYAAVGIDSPILAIAGAQTTDQGNYYCDVTINSNGETLPSRTAFLIVKQALAHWTMDQADFVAGQYLDIAGTHNATPSETPVFVPGAGPDMPHAGAAVIDPNSFDSNIGTWNPLETTGQITISTWLKWNGDTTNISGGYEILSKSSGWDLTLSMWNLKLRSVSGGKAGIWFYNKSNSLIRTAGLIPADTWTHVCAAYGSSVARLYIDGELVVEKTGAVMGTGTDSTLKLGGTSASNAFPGAMDEVMILNYLASEEDAAALYYQTSKEGVCLYPPAIDFNSDCRTDLLDFAIFAEKWLTCGKVPAEACGL